MILYSDISALIDMSIFTGIQRVTVELLSRLEKNTDWDIRLLHYDPKEGNYQIVKNDFFHKRYVLKDTKKKVSYKDTHIRIEEIEKDSVFLDIDSSWMSQVKRSYLLPKLKGNGVKIVAHIYDIIPINFPQYCHQQTIFNFMDYIAAHIVNADYFLVNAQATLDDIQELAEKLELPHVHGAVVPLGADFAGTSEYNNSDLDKKVVEAVNNGKYILMVGTIEPRKNHKLLIEAFDNYLQNTEINIILAGRSGWNMEAFEEMIRNHPLLNKRIFHFNSVPDIGLDYLYKNAFLVTFLSYSEGFGLPLIEAFQKKAPVIASNMRVSREIAGDCCDFFEQDNAYELAELIKKYLEAPEKRQEQINKINGFHVTTWDESAEIIKEKLLVGVVNEIG